MTLPMAGTTWLVNYWTKNGARKLTPRQRRYFHDLGKFWEATKP